jgi:enoyl-CoA hydratase
MSEESELVATERRGHIFVITMQREAKRNAMNRELADALDAALNELDDDPSLWVGILQSSSVIFCAGSDLTANGDYKTERGGEYGIIRRRRKKPLVAAVEGQALGGGFEIVLSCDLVVASSRASFSLPEVSIGVLPTSAGLFRAPAALPLNVARELILTGEPLSADRAWSLGLVNVITEPNTALEGALQLAERICSNAPVSVAASLKAVNDLAAANDDAGWDRTAEALKTLSTSADAREGIAAFLEKRSPQWKGH